MSVFNFNTLFLQLNNFKNVIKTNNSLSLIKKTTRKNYVCLYSTEALPLQDSKNTSEKPTKKINKAMLAYLERAKAHEEFIKKEKLDFQIGKRHLANMMGENPDFFTQKQIDDAIAYLFPSGLFDPHARPVMRPPEEIFPARKEAQFDETGRPFHTFFYTIKPNYYQALHDLVDKIHELNKIEDAFLAKGILPDPNNEIDLKGSDWIKSEELENMLLEKINRDEYEYFLSSIKALANHPYANQAKDFLMKFRKEVKIIAKTIVAPTMQYTEDGRPFIEVPDCRRRSARGTVKVLGNGTGKITINNQSIDYFEKRQDRDEVVFPLMFTNMADKVDVEASVRYGGSTGQSGAIRWGISWALRGFVDAEMIEKMRLAGLLTRDWRTRERKKPGQEGARRKFTWNKR